MEERAPILIQRWQAGRLETFHELDGLAALIREKGSRTWVDLTDPSPELVQQTTQALGVHPLVAEDIIERNERAKVQLVDDVVHVVAFVLRRDGRPGGEAEVEAHEIDFVLGHGFLLSAHRAVWDASKSHQLKVGLAPLLAKGADHVLWALVDAIVDGYFPVFDQLGDEIDALQDAAVQRPVPATLETLFRLKRELIRIRHVVAPSREVFAQLTSREFDQISEHNVYYFRDVYDHLIRLNDELDSFRELTQGSLEIYLSTINNNLSTIMKRLTGVTVILAGIGAIAGLFGMSEAATAIEGRESPGFYVVVALTVLSSLLAAWILRRIDWL